VGKGCQGTEGSFQVFWICAVPVVG